ncbi:6-bladed beta-propeller [Draconibacterium sediminis]|uniref:6-bladed beta-propeller n=1 Tax=Draconibacterium sediminis TaxID=1544798 RepID=UPI0026EA5626|nr:6-bladed beta-propeller [Draconibacterium sediminis]
MKIKHQPLQFFTVLLVVLGICNSCQEKNKTQNTEAASSFYTIPFDEIVKNKQEVKLSEIASDAKIIQFENIPEAMLGDVEDIELTKDYIFVKFWEHPVLQFSHDGKFIRDIGKRGKGPGEYGTCMKLSIDEKNEKIYIHTGELDVKVFNFNGDYLKTYNYEALENFMCFWIWGRDSCLISYFEPIDGTEPFVFIEHDAKGDTLQTIANHIFWDSKGEFGSITPFFGVQNFYYCFNGKSHLKGAYNDTIYTYNNSNKLVPKYCIDLGRHKLPDDLIYERKRTRPVPDNLIWTGVHETSDNIFIPYGYHYDIEKPELRNEKQGLVLYKKNTKVGLAIKETKQGGLIDDITGGPDFRPKTTNGNTAIMLVTALDMKLYLESDAFKNKAVKFPEEKEKLIQLNKTLNENDNHFLVLVKLKD